MPLSPMVLCQALLISLLLIGLLTDLLILNPDYREDSFREVMYGLRSRLFDYAAEGNVSFEEPAFRNLIDLANGVIRFAHHLTIWRLLVLFVFRQSPGLDLSRTTFDEAFCRSLGSVHCHEISEKMVEFRAEIDSVIQWQLVRTCFLLRPLLWATFFKMTASNILIYLMDAAKFAELKQNAISQVIRKIPIVLGIVPTTFIEDQAVNCPAA